MTGAAAGALRLDGRTALVTDAGGGLGAPIAAALTSAGATVVHAGADDLADATRLQAVVARTLAELGPPTVLVNATDRRTEGDKLLTDVTVEEFDALLDLHLTATWRAMRAVTPVMIEAGGGSIVNLCSVAAFVSTDPVGYSASKAAVVGLTRNAAVELGRHGVRANVLCLGAGPDDDPGRTYLAVHGRPATHAEIAQGALFLASDASSSTSGAVLEVDAGWTIMRPTMAVR